MNAERDLPELLITQLAYHRQIPILGICRGLQTLAVALGGKVTQHLTSALKHTQEAARELPTHSITIAKDSQLYTLLGSEQTYVNSFHHQAVTDGGPHFRVVAQAMDGF